MPAFILSAFSGYLAGSFPSSYIAGRIIAGIDIRKHGSGNAGATNVFRVLGPRAGIAVLAADIFKGWLPVFVFAPLIARHAGIPEMGDWLKIAAGLAAVCGHNWTVFLGFKGGKGVAVSAGALLGIAPGAVGLSAAVWLAVTALTGYVSLGSMTAAVSLPLFIRITGGAPEVIGLGAAAAVFVLIRHRPNIARLLRGEENSLRRRRA